MPRALSDYHTTSAGKSQQPAHGTDKGQPPAEGELTKTRASMVCEPSLALCARDIDLGSYLLLGKGEEATGGRMRDSVTSDAMEALIGAVYLDGGFTSAKEFIHRFVLTDLEDKKLFYDSKTILQEMVQAEKMGEITYRGHVKGGKTSLSSMFEAVGAHAAGKITDEDLCEYENKACPTCGSCSGMYTANSMNCLTEALGMGLRGNGTIPRIR